MTVSDWLDKSELLADPGRWKLMPARATYFAPRPKRIILTVLKQISRSSPIDMFLT